MNSHIVYFNFVNSLFILQDSQLDHLLSLNFTLFYFTLLVLLFFPFPSIYFLSILYISKSHCFSIIFQFNMSFSHHSWCGLGFCYLSVSTFSAAEKAFNRASKLCPKDTVLLCLLGKYVRSCFVCVCVCRHACV
jgi:hypothetical protein